MHQLRNYIHTLRSNSFSEILIPRSRTLSLGRVGLEIQGNFGVVPTPHLALVVATTGQELFNYTCGYYCRT